MLGARGEESARNFLLESGYLILDLNIRYKNHEVDLVALDLKTDEIVFVEVKASSSIGYGHPSQKVDRRKLASLQQAAWAYLKSRRLAQDFRFDIITVNPSGIEHFENVTW